MRRIKILLIKITSSFFFLGYIPFLSGTWASFAVVLGLGILKPCFLLYFILMSVFITLGFIVSGPAEDIFGVKDAPQIVIDEVAGMFLSCMFLPINFKTLFFGFLLFRILDAVKIFPAYYFEKFKRAKGIMLDDIVAGLYTNCILQVVFRFALYRHS